MVEKDKLIASISVPVGSRLVSVLEVAYRARRPVLLEGPTGIGKSEIVEQVTRKLGIQHVILDLSLLEPPDLVGLPVIKGDVTSYAFPSILPRSGNGILMLEELNRAERYIQQPALQLLTARKLHEYVLPEGWSTCAAINPEQGDYQVTPLDVALRARFLNISVCPNRNEWVAWAKRNNIHPAIISIATVDDHIFDQIPPRTWKYVSDMIQSLTVTELKDKILLSDILSGYLPQPWITRLLSAKLLVAEEEISAYDILKKFHTDKALQEKIAKWIKMGRTDKLNDICSRIYNILESPETGALVANNEFSLESFEKFIKEIPGDLREMLQMAFGESDFTLRLMNFSIRDVIDNYKTTLDKQVMQWLKNDFYRHRIISLVNSTCSQLATSNNLNEIRKSNHSRINLGYFIAQIGKDYAEILVKTLDKLGIIPIFPKT